MLRPLLVTVVHGQQIEFSHRQAIAASSVLRLIAIDLAALVIERLGSNGFVYRAAKRTFFESPTLPETKARPTMVKAFNDVMSNRYRVKSYCPREALALLREMNLTKQCSARFNEIKRQAASDNPK